MHNSSYWAGCNDFSDGLVTGAERQIPSLKPVSDINGTPVGDFAGTPFDPFLPSDSPGPLRPGAVSARSAVFSA